ncbi:MAG TPA: long-chain fatty acid--CoA ligase [Polyangiaceae bacterium]|nr:long-chain fatty acid--CoA ligase [Polyangiaceae bacterium]
MQSTMMDCDLTVSSIVRHGAGVHGGSLVVTGDVRALRRSSFADVALRAERLAAALARLGVRPGDRVATLSSNHQEHLEAYLAVPSMGAVLHTLNPRLSGGQLAFVMQHAEDKILIVDAGYMPVFDSVASLVDSVEHVLVVDADGDVVQSIDGSSWKGSLAPYARVVDAERPGFSWPDVDERSAAAMCYTSGTTGDPKGVVYSHRSIVLHTYAACAASCFALTDHDRVLPIVPMFHANAWGLPYAAWASGSSLVMPGRRLHAEAICDLIARERPTVSGAVPTVWNDILRHGETHAIDLSSLRLVICGGSAVPRVLMQRFQQEYGIRIIQAWGMTETSPIGALAFPPACAAGEEQWRWRSKAGRLVPGVEARIVDQDGRTVPRDGLTVGEIEVRGPWITGSYYRTPSPDRFHDGWLRTGDVGTLDGHGFLTISDRSKDVIKSGGEWISSVALENAIMGHPDVAEVAVIGIPDARWEERPLACVVMRRGRSIDLDRLRDFLASRVERWWIPDSWAFIEGVPRTGVGKFDKKALRAAFASGAIRVEKIEKEPTRVQARP